VIFGLWAVSSLSFFPASRFCDRENAFFEGFLCLATCIYWMVSSLKSSFITFIMATSNNNKSWIRGVNLGGWLVQERYIVPYQFSITDCHLVGEYCWYPGALSAPPEAKHNISRICDLDKCNPYRTKTVGTNFDYPNDEWTLSEAFSHNQTIGEEWFNFHFDNFITKDDLLFVKNSGITHLRVPLPHWILGNIMADEPWIAGKRWEAFKRLCGWARELDLQVWPNLHTAPGSQNGFDNSGKEDTKFTCAGWGKIAENVQRTLDIVHEITFRISQDGLTDVVTGFGILNEPFGDCNDFVYQKFLDDGLAIVRNNLPKSTSVFVSDKFFAPVMNDGQWWLDPKKYQDTYLDTHFYHVFAPEVRAFGPNQHLELVCHPDDRQLSIESCCYQDAPKSNTTISEGVRRISSEWSVAYDCHPGELLSIVMAGIVENGIAPDFDRELELEPGRKDFLKNFGEAQMVAYEDKDFGLSDGWFYWTIKMEGGAFLEWDFSRGVREGWLSVVPSDKASEDVFGTCDDILHDTKNDTSIVHPFPWGDEPYWRDGVPYSPPKHLPPHTWDPNDISSSDTTTSNFDQVSHDGSTRSAMAALVGFDFLALVGAITLIIWCIKGVAMFLVACCREHQKRQGKNAYGNETVDEGSPLMLNSFHYKEAESP
jgi:glucan 1,3-beta-glucosidase